MRCTTISKRMAAFFVLAAVGGVSCSDVSGTPESEDARVTVDHVAGQDPLALTIRNEGPDMILYRPAPCAGGDLEMRVGTMWLGIDVPSGETTSCYDLTGGVPIPIPPSGAYQTEHSVLKAWIPGEYRFKLDLRDEDDNLLSDDARTSNTFRIDE